MTIWERKREIGNKRKELIFELIHELADINEEKYDNDAYVRAHIQSRIMRVGQYLRNLDIAYDVLDKHEDDHAFTTRMEFLT